MLTRRLAVWLAVFFAAAVAECLAIVHVFEELDR